MRYILAATVALAVVGLTGNAGAVVVSPSSGLQQLSDELGAFELVAKKGKKGKRARAGGHTFNVGCPIPLPVIQKTCSARGKTKEDARGVCMKQNPGCWVVG
jgi:hypothetical protein